MLNKIEGLGKDGYSVEFGPCAGEEMKVVLRKGIYHIDYILPFSDLRDSILDPELVVCELLDSLQRKFREAFWEE